MSHHLLWKKRYRNNGGWNFKIQSCLNQRSFISGRSITTEDVFTSSVPVVQRVLDEWRRVIFSWGVVIDNVFLNGSCVNPLGFARFFAAFDFTRSPCLPGAGLHGISQKSCHRLSFKSRVLYRSLVCFCVKFGLGGKRPFFGFTWIERAT